MCKNCNISAKTAKGIEKSSVCIIIRACLKIALYILGKFSVCGGRQQEFSQKILVREQAESLPFFTRCVSNFVGDADCGNGFSDTL